MQPSAENARDRATNSKKTTAKHKAVGELRELLINALYLALFLCAFAAYRALITGELLHGPLTFISAQASLRR
jgi:hypothetical protein